MNKSIQDILDILVKSISDFPNDYPFYDHKIEPLIDGDGYSLNAKYRYGEISIIVLVDGDSYVLYDDLERVSVRSNEMNFSYYLNTVIKECLIEDAEVVNNFFNESIGNVMSHCVKINNSSHMGSTTRGYDNGKNEQ